MSRRSFRLMSSGYYNSDEDSDSSSMTNISYRENPVKVFKKKARTSKARSKTPTRVKSNGVSGSPSPSISHGHPSPPSSQPTMGTTAYVSTVATPEPPMYSSSTTTETPASDKSHHRRPGIHHQPSLKELRQSTMDSSGYSSSEDPNRRPTRSATNGTGRTDGSSIAGYRHRINSAFFSLMDSVSLMAIPVRSKMMHAAALAKTPLSSRMKKACGLFLLLFIIILCIWFLLPWFTSKTLPQTEHQSEFASSVVDPAVVNAAVEAKMQNVLEELQVKQDEFLSQLKEIVQLDLENMKTRLEGVDSSNRLFLERELAVLAKQLSDFKTDFKSATASLKLRIQDLEAQNTKLSEEWTSFQQRPPPAPSPDTSTKPVESQLTPELQQALKKWLTDYIREQGPLWLIDKGSGSESGYPMADKMPDFALETQGASVISTRCSETYRVRSACVSLFGFPLWYPVESPRTVIQGSPVLLPGKCWAFHGVQGTLVISLSHPITITHVTLDHLPRYKSPTGRIDSAPKDFEVYGMKNDSEEGTLLGTFTYDEYGESTQTFKLPNPSDEVYRFVELRVLSNWGHVEYTCLYRFRVHGHISK